MQVVELVERRVVLIITEYTNLPHMTGLSLFSYELDSSICTKCAADSTEKERKKTMDVPVEQTSF